MALLEEFAIIDVIKNARAKYGSISFLSVLKQARLSKQICVIIRNEIKKKRVFITSVCDKSSFEMFNALFDLGGWHSASIFLKK